MSKLLDRTDYASLSGQEIARRIKAANARMDRCTDIDAMVGDMFTIQELNAVLLSRESENAA